MIKPFKAAYTKDDISDLKKRIELTRWPEKETEDSWKQGVPLKYLKEITSYWVNEFDWFKTQDLINSYPNYTTEVNGLDIHFIHIKSKYDDAFPLLICHGWPGSFIEFLKIIEPLTHPKNASDAFHLVLPSIPGYGFSGIPESTGWDVENIASAFREIMNRLNYTRYGVQGGDWGSSISTAMAVQDPKAVAGLHLNRMDCQLDEDTKDGLTEKEKDAVVALQEFRTVGAGYMYQQSTKPQTLGYALMDSPTGLCAWILEKLHAWSDCHDHPENAFTKDEMLSNITLYWLTGTAVSSARLYYESKRWENWQKGAKQATVAVPMGGIIFPKEHLRPSKRWAEKKYVNLIHYTEAPKGGHFAAWEQPAILADDIQNFFGKVR